MPGPGSQLAALVRAHVGVITDDVAAGERLRPRVAVALARSPRRDGKRRDAYERRFRTVIGDGIAAGTFAPVDPVVAAAFILTALNGLVTLVSAGRPARSPARSPRPMADLALRAVLLPESPVDEATTDDDARSDRRRLPNDRSFGRVGRP